MKAIKMSLFIFCLSTVLVACKSSSSEPVNNEKEQEVEFQKKGSKKSNLGGGVLPISIYPFSDDKDSSL